MNIVILLASLVSVAVLRFLLHLMVPMGVPMDTTALLMSLMAIVPLRMTLMAMVLLMCLVLK